MKKAFLAAVLFVAAFSSANAQFGKFTPSETKKVADEQTGVELTILTDTEKNDKFIYQTDPMWTPDGRYLMFRSSTRAGEAPKEVTMPDGKVRKFSPTQYFFVDTTTGEIIQVTDGNDVGSVFLGNRSNTLFVNRRVNGEWTMYSMDLDKLFADARKGKKGKVGSFESRLNKIGVFPDTPEMGRPGGWCVNSEDEYAFITVTREGTPEEIAAMKAKAFVPRDDQPVKVSQSLSGLRKMNLKTGEVTKIADMDFKVGHIQASRFRPNEIVFCNETGGDADQRMWYADADACTFKPLYKETPLDWVTHETFGTEDYVYFNVLGWQDRLRKQASGIFRINLRTDDVECLGNVEMEKDRVSALTGRGFWHCNSTRDNQWAAGDTFGGSVWIINVGNGYRFQIASDTKMKPDHAQPFFSPDGKKLCFQSGHWSNGERLNLVIVDLTKIPEFNQYNK